MEIKLFKGIVALFTSGILFNPMILTGIISGVVIMNITDGPSLHQMLTSLHFYMLFLLIAAFFTYAAKRVYYPGGSKINWKATALEIFAQFITLISTVIFTCLFLFYFIWSSNESTVAARVIRNRQGITDVQQTQNTLSTEEKNND